MSPLFRKKESGPGEPLDSHPNAAPNIPDGDQQCARTGCENHNGLQCSYVDRRIRRCETAWCPDHRAVISGAIYCPRHAGIMIALLASSRKGHLPDLDNRAPSLANWIGNDIDPSLRELLDSIRDSAQGENLVVEPVAYVFGSADQTHRWERAWKLANHTGVTLKVGIDVDETKDHLVRVRVGQHTIGQVTPPWVEHHQKREWVDPDTDIRERTSFYETVCNHIKTAVIAERQAEQERPYFGTRG